MQVYKIFGSFELLGNPVSLIEDLGTGVVDMFYDPLYELFKGKGRKAGLKFAKGVYNLIYNSIINIYKASVKILGTVMKLLTSITLHTEYIH